MTMFQYTLLIVVISICVYTLVDRICKCIEHCATAKAYGEFRKTGSMTKMEDVEAAIVKINEGKENVKKYVE